MLKKPHEFQMSGLLYDLVYGSYLKSEASLYGPDSLTRDLSSSRELFKKLKINFNQWPRATVTGSKGKGSTAVMLSSILAASGEKVGLITSPELRRFNERIRIDGKCVTDEDLEEAACEIAPTVKSVVANLKSPKYLGPGGVVLALAAKLFIRYKVTAVVVEAGRGGEYDESRLIEANVSIITPIMLKHADKIGPTLEDIARTKTYITTPGGTIVTTFQKSIVKKVISKIAEELSSPMLALDQDAEIYNIKSCIEGTFFDLNIKEDMYKNIRTSLAGSYQAENAAVAILAALELNKFGAKCTRDGIYKGVSQVSWPGRCQILQKNPWIILEGAINKTIAEYLTQIVKGLPVKKITAVVAIHREEDLEGVCSVIQNIVDKLILTEVHSTSLLWDKKALLKSASKYFKKVNYITEVDEAFKFVEKTVKKDEGVLLLGHQSFVGAALMFWEIETCTLW